MIATVVKGGYTMLQLALALEVDSKSIIETLHAYGVTTTYHELRRYKISAAAQHDSMEPKPAEKLIQVIADNV